MKKIYVIGPKGIGKSTFISRHFKPDSLKNVIESSEMIVPEDYLTIFLILPNSYEKIRKRIDIGISEFYEWLDFYHKIDDWPRLRLVEEI